VVDRTLLLAVLMDPSLAFWVRMLHPLSRL
jgi:hypothetical protein